MRLARIRLAKKGTTNAFLQYKEEGGLQVSEAGVHSNGNGTPWVLSNIRDECATGALNSGEWTGTEVSTPILLLRK